ncbi:MAG: phosphoribosylanthranilate isomerase [Planctomycetota bacterium]|nr:MAG: phosphoribosylanthranilate isomerase [Planctomycetota bacterium]
MWVKICGWNNQRVLEAALVAGTPDAIGLNFYPPSVRYVSIETAQAMRECVPAGVAVVGVFVNSSRGQILQTVKQVGLTHVQLHGDETPEFVASLGSVPVIRVYRPKVADIGPIAADLETLRHWGATPWACLVDAYHAGEYGGTGAVAPWAMLTNWPTDWPPLILAGGLTPTNVTSAIQQVKPFGVDAASGCERIKGEKDPALVRAFIEAVRTRR